MQECNRNKKIFEKYSSGISFNTLAKKYNLSRERIRQIVCYILTRRTRKLNLSWPEIRKINDDFFKKTRKLISKNEKLNDPKNIEITNKYLSSENITISDLAKLFNVSNTCITNRLTYILKNKHSYKDKTIKRLILSRKKKRWTKLANERGPSKYRIAVKNCDIDYTVKVLASDTKIGINKLKRDYPELIKFHNALVKVKRELNLNKPLKYEKTSKK